MTRQSRLLAAVLWFAVVSPMTAGARAPDADAPAQAAGYMSVAELVRLQRSGQRIHLADLRAQTDHDNFHIEGAARLTPLQLRTLDAWKHDTLVLIGSGMAYQALETLREQLRADGFGDARILDGGTRQWAQALGKGRSATALSTPQQLDLDGDADRWTVLTANSEDALDGASVPILAAHLDDPRELLRELPEALQRRRPGAASGPVPNLLIAAKTVQEGMRVLTRIEASLAANVFVLDGSVADLRADLQRRRALAAAAGGAGTFQVGGQCW